MWVVFFVVCVCFDDVDDDGDMEDTVDIDKYAYAYKQDYFDIYVVISLYVARLVTHFEMK